MGTDSITEGPAYHALPAQIFNFEVFFCYSKLFCFRKAALIMVWKTCKKQEKLTKEKVREEIIFLNGDESEK